MKKVALVVVAIIAIGLGGLWLLQGLGLVTIAPILCVADCAPLEGPSSQWAIIGAVTVLGGLIAGFSRVDRGAGLDPVPLAFPAPFPYSAAYSFGRGLNGGSAQADRDEFPASRVPAL